MIKRFVFAIICIYLYDYPFAQIQFLHIQTILMIMYIISVKPFKEALLNKLEIFNEICILLTSYHLSCFTMFVSDPLIKYNIGWSLLALTSLNMLVNTSIIMVQVSR
jgi:hypothetical protein